MSLYPARPTPRRDNRKRRGEGAIPAKQRCTPSAPQAAAKGRLTYRHGSGGPRTQKTKRYASGKTIKRLADDGPFVNAEEPDEPDAKEAEKDTA